MMGSMFFGDTKMRNYVKSTWKELQNLYMKGTMLK